jgi:hypothetical protein
MSLLRIGPASVGENDLGMIRTCDGAGFDNREGRPVVLDYFWS